MVIAPAVPSALFGQWGDAAQTVLEGMVVLFAIWALTSYGVVSLLGWAGRRTSSQLPAYLNLIVRALPLLLLFMTFLFVNAEVWEVAGTLTGPIYIAVLAVFFILGNVFLMSRLPALMRAQNTFASWAEVIDLVDAAGRGSRRLRASLGRHSHGGASGRSPADAPTVQYRPRRRVLPGDPDHRHGAGDVRILRALRVLGDRVGHRSRVDRRRRSRPRRRDGRLAGSSSSVSRCYVSPGFLAAFAGMYFTVVLSTDATYRDEFAEDIGPELRQALAMRLLYRRALVAT